MDDDEVITFDGNRRMVVPRALDVDPGARYGMRFRGVFKMIVRDVRCFRTTVRLDGLVECRVSIEVKVPDRDDANKLVVIEFQDTFISQYHHQDRGMTPEQSCIVQAIKVLWEHELEEGVMANGECVWDPEAAHGHPRRRERPSQSP